MKIYLDDVRTPKEGNWTIVRNYDEFKDLIDSIDINEVSLISFDHDLGDTAMMEYFNNTINTGQINYDNIQEKTGMDCVNYLIDKILDHNCKIPTLNCHSHNTAGTINITTKLNNFLKFKKINEICTTIKYPFSIVDIE